MKMTYKKASEEELEIRRIVRENSIERLFNNQKINLEMLQHYIIRDDMYDRNDCNKLLQEIIALNLIILKKIEYEKRK